ncbi:MAG: hypothetical protein IJ763_01155 [Lachnospiraceae bacterium]|nr:hypothetical protein [Lachnospiraceae bacterium]
MLGKCIKNEIINRYKPLLLAYIIELVYSPIYYMLAQIQDDLSNYYMEMFVILLRMLWVFINIGVVGVVFIWPLVDFRNRIFKDQGYLTNTLPVKTSTLMISRVIVDILTYISAAIVIPFASCVAAMDFGVYKDFAYWLSDLTETFGSRVSPASFITFIILIGVIILASIMQTQWMFNVAYAFGHSFSNNKKVMSIVGMVLVYIAFQVIGTLLLYVLSKSGMTQVISNGLDSNVQEANRFLAIISIFEVLSSGVCVALTGWIIKNKLNLE